MSADDSNSPAPTGDSWFCDLIARLPDGVLVVDQAGMIRYANPAAQHLFKKTESELIGAPLGISIKPGDQPEMELPGMVGAARFAEVCVGSAEWHGNAAWIVTLRDVTERKLIAEALRESEGRFRSLLQDVPNVAIQGYGLDGGVHYWNKASEMLYGYSEQEALEGNLLTLIIPPEMRDTVREALKNVAAGGGIDSGELSLMCKDGSRVSVYSSHSVVRRPGQPPELFCIDIALTERNALEEQLRQSQRLESVGQLTGGVAHDFNNLLTVILGNAELLSEQLASNSRLHSLADMISRAAQRGAELTRHLLAFARKQTLDPKAVDVNRLIVGVKGLLHRSLGEHIEIELALGDDPMSAMVDPGQLEGALLNLAINARDAMPNGGMLTIQTANIELDAEDTSRDTQLQPGHYVMLAVTDTGFGIAPEFLERVFEPFYTTKEMGKGSGLGLSMVYGFVKQSKGHIKLSSEPGVGTTIKMYLPASADPIVITEESSTYLNGGDELILLVEDDELVRTFVSNQLCSLGYRVRIAGNGNEALAILRAQNDIDLLFTDIMMPGGMNGRELADQARAINPSLKVLFTSGYNENVIDHHGHLDPDVELLSKPYTRLELATKVRLVIQGSVASKP